LDNASDLDVLLPFLQAALKGKILASGLAGSQPVTTAWAAAASFRGDEVLIGGMRVLDANFGRSHPRSLRLTQDGNHGLVMTRGR
jgi:catalase (peroxidase I)